MRHRGIVGLGALALVLGGWIGWQFTGDGSQPAPVKAVQARIDAPAAAGSIGTPEPELDTHLKLVLARPLFGPDRRPIGERAHNPATLSRLTGIVITGSRKIAIFDASGGSQPLAVEVGSHINAFEVTSISDKSVTVVGPDGTIVMRPSFDPAGMQPPSPSAPPRG